jgi:ppGpp synthetase/RelA/SpoT-type nucleotidyltranferase
MPNQPENYDFFVSYARSDNANGWITRFVEELLAEHKRFSAGRELKSFFDQHAITTGADWQLYLAHGIAHSRLFLAFLSPNYFASEWCRKEWRAWMDAEIAQHILTAGVRPIYIVEVPGLTGKDQLSDQQLAQKLAELSKFSEPDRAKLIAEMPPVVKHLRRRQLTHNQPFCDVHAFFDAGLDALRREELRQVLDQLAHDLDHHAELLAKADASLSTVPAYNRHFTGRLDELLLLRERLIKDDRTGVIYGIQGLGGIGKTELALTYAHAYASAYLGGRFLIRCEGKSALRDAVLGQSDFAGLFGDQISDEERKLPDAYFAAILRCLRARLDQLGHVLLVLDNVSDLALLGHQQTQALTALGPQLHLLATTRMIPPAGGKGNWLSLGQLPDDDALDLLEKYRPFATAAEREAARRIVKRLGGFTLAVELAAAHLAEHPDVTCARMADIIGLEDLENPVVVESADRQNIRYEHDRRLSAVLGPTLTALSPGERRALEYAALLPPDCVPLPWLKTLVVADFPEIGQPARLTDPWSDLWRRLEKLALFTRPEEETTEPRLMRAHRLVQALLQRNMTELDYAARDRALNRLIEEELKRFASMIEASQCQQAPTALCQHEEQICAPGADQLGTGRVANQVTAYRRVVGHYEAYAVALKRVLEHACELCAPGAAIETRAKTPGSFASKYIRRQNKYPDPVNQMTDLCGGRIVVQTLQQAEAIRRFIEDNFTVLERDGVGLVSRKDFIGYRHMNFLVRLRYDRAESIGFLPAEIQLIGHRIAEVQLQTRMQNAWANLHDRLYRRSPRLSADSIRIGGWLAVTMAHCDQRRSHQSLE